MAHVQQYKIIVLPCAAGSPGGGSPDKGHQGDEENRQLLLSRIRAYAAEYELLANTLAGVRMFFAYADE